PHQRICRSQSQVRLSLGLESFKVPLIPIQSQIGGTGAAVTFAKNGNGMVRAMYRLSSVIRIKGERRKREVELLTNAVTILLQLVFALTYYE
ncbi:hypothetical protein, partial [Chroococcidiopsis cubana]